jgi:hypothetical protein
LLRFQHLHPQSKFVANLRSLHEVAPTLDPFDLPVPSTDAERWCTELWRNHGSFLEAPFMVQKYPGGIWHNDTSPSTGQFIKWASCVDAHEDATVCIQGEMILIALDLFAWYNARCRFRTAIFNGCSF